MSELQTQPSSKTQAEKTGEKFQLSSLLRVQEQTWDALRQIAAEIRPGMLEEEAYELAKKKLIELGFSKSWHRPYVRFGTNSVLMYGKPSQPGVRLGEDDLFYLDIGPVKEGYEGDAGDTFVTGQNPRMRKCIEDTRKLFQEMKRQWKAEGLTGKDLYSYGESEARKLGWVLNTEWNGHRVADFPHQIYFKGNLCDMEFTPSPGVWILEVHLCDPEGGFGAFFEDLLY
jgi:Xaa-Pro aminopeptidase